MSSQLDFLVFLMMLLRKPPLCFADSLFIVTTLRNKGVAFYIDHNLGELSTWRRGTMLNSVKKETKHG